MEDSKLIPAHVFFARWFIRIRWFSILILLPAIFVVDNWSPLSIREGPLYILTGITFAINCLNFFLYKRISVGEQENTISLIKKCIHFQIFCDMIILTLILHYSGGIENPMVMFYFLHMIFSCSIFTRFSSFIHSGSAILLFTSLAFLECYGVIPHNHLTKTTMPDLYQNELYIIGYSLIFITISVLIVGLTHLMKYKSITVEEAYVKTNLELEKKDKLQNQYVMHVTHDIKGHLAAIISRLSVVRTRIIGPLNKEQEEFINRAYSRTEQLSEFVQDLLSLSRKRLLKESENETFCLKETINKVASRIEIMAEDHSIKFDMTIDKSVGLMTGNPLTIEELYSNLLRNSVSYTPEGGRIHLSVKSNDDHFLSHITDSGIGIPKDEIPKVFNEFFRGSNVKKSSKGGSGLGLSIAKQIVDNHQGKIWVDSEPGIWTKFSFIIPKKPELKEADCPEE